MSAKSPPGPSFTGARSNIPARLSGTHDLHSRFVPYGDADAFRARIDAQRQAERRAAKARD